MRKAALIRGHHHLHQRLSTVGPHCCTVSSTFPAFRNNTHTDSAAPPGRRSTADPTVCAPRAGIRGVITVGNTNFGAAYCLAGKVISAKSQVPYLYGFELLGNDQDLLRVREGLLRMRSTDHMPIHPSTRGGGLERLDKTGRERMHEFTLGLPDELYELELEYSCLVFDDLGMTDDVQVFVRHNANRVLMNLGYRAILSAEEVIAAPDTHHWQLTLQSALEGLVPAVSVRIPGLMGLTRGSDGFNIRNLQTLHESCDCK